jgi:hypothetical protein
MSNAVPSGRSAAVPGFAAEASHPHVPVDAGGLSHLRQLVREGDESGPDLDGDAVFAALRARFGVPRIA